MWLVGPFDVQLSADRPGRVVMVATRFTATPTAATTISTASPSTARRAARGGGPIGVVGHEGGDDEERDAVGRGRQDLGPPELQVREPGLGACRQSDRHEGPGNGADVDQHVPGVGQQDERVRGDGGPDLERHEGDEENQRDFQGAAVGPHRRLPGRMVVAVSHRPSRGPRG